MPSTPHGGLREAGSLFDELDGESVMGDTPPHRHATLHLPLPTKTRRSIYQDEAGEVLANGVIVHPKAAELFQRCPWVRQIPVFGLAIEGYGPTFVVSLNFAYFLCKGIADNIIAASRNPMMMKRFKISGERYQRLASLYNMGWAIKAFIALLTDTFAFLGYTKRWYMLISCVGGAAFALGYGLLPAKPSSANIAAGFIFLTCFGKANVDILSEGHYSRLIRRNPVPGPALVSCIWVCILMGTLIASVIQGPLSDSNMMQVGVFISAALQLVTCIFFVFNWYGERTNREERMQDVRDAKEAVAKARAQHAKEVARKDASSCDVAEDILEQQAAQKVRQDPDLTDKHENSVSCSPLPPPQCDDELRCGDVSLTGLVDGTPHPLVQTLLEDAREVAKLNPGVVCDMDREDEEEEDEEKMPPIATCLCGMFEINKGVILNNWKVVVYCVIMTCSVVTMVCVTILGTTWDLMYACIVLTVVCIVCAFLTLQWVIAKANVFTYAYFTLYVALPGALDNFFLADEACLPGGPHFSYSFYNTVTAVLQNVAGITGVTMFTYVFSKMNYQVTMGVSVTLMVMASVFDIVMLQRWNLAIGIPDHAMYLCGDAVIYQCTYMLSYMPVTLLMSRLCPRGSESMIYALMAGFANLGQTMSNTIGSLLIEFRFPFKTDAPCDFSNVLWLVLIGHIGMPLAIVPLSFLLLPRVRICDDIDVNGHVATEQLTAERKEKEEAAKHEDKRVVEGSGEQEDEEPAAAVPSAADSASHPTR